ncbi:hypothetical protein D3C75_576910 [compost metagenome]
MVAGEHDHLDAGPAAAADRLRHLSARRVLDADQAGVDQLAFQLDAQRLAAHPPPGQCQHAQAARGHVLLGLAQALALRLVERLHPIGSQRLAA